MTELCKGNICIKFLAKYLLQAANISNCKGHSKTLDIGFDKIIHKGKIKRILFDLDLFETKH